MSKKDFDTNKYLELAKSLKLDSMDDINDLFKNLSKAIIENSLNAEMDEHLGYDKWDQTSRNKSNNYRKSYSNKKSKIIFWRIWYQNTKRWECYVWTYIG